MKKILLLSVLCIAFSSLKAQNYLEDATNKYFSSGVDVRRFFAFPTGCGNPSLPIAIDSARRRAATYFDSCNHRFWIYDPKLKAWDSVRVGAGGSGSSYAFTLPLVNGSGTVGINGLSTYGTSGQIPISNGTGWTYLTPTYILPGDTSGMLVNYRHWLAGYTKNSDTASMLANYRHWLAGYTKNSDTAAMLANYRHWLAGYIKPADTAAMLSNYRHWLEGYVTLAQARAGISLTTTGSSGAATYNSSTGVLNVPQYSGGGGSYTLQADSLFGWGLDFDHNKSSRVDIGAFYPPMQHYECFWEFWIKPSLGNVAGYLISADYGGAHPILFGVQDATDSTFTLTGNFYPGTGTLGDFTFVSSSQHLYNKVHHVALLYDGTTVWLFIDGVPVGRKTGPFTRNTTGYGGPKTYIGGSDHNNYDGIIYRVRGFEGVAPVASADFFTPSKRFLPGVAGEVFNMDFTYPRQQFNNDGSGYLGEKGNGAMTAQTIIATQFTGAVNDSLRLSDTLLPQFVKSTITQPAYTGLSSSIPGSAKIYDGFNREDIVPAWDVLLRIDSTEGGTLGKKKWNLRAGSGFGIQNKQLWMFRGGGDYTLITVDAATSDQDVRAEWTDGEQQLCLTARYTNANNRVILDCTPGPGGTGYLVKYVSGTPTTLGTFTIPSYTTLRLVVNGTTATAYTDGTSQVSGSISDVSLGTEAGISTGNSVSRVKSFSVY